MARHPDDRPAKTSRLEYCLFDTALGCCGLAWSSEGLARLQLPEADAAATERRIARGGARRCDAPPGWVAEAIAALNAYFRGEPAMLDTLPVDLAEGADRAIYEATRAIGRGSTLTYGALARRAGNAGGARAVGQAMARNPLPVIIPCHRVLAAGNAPGGFSAPGGLATKRRLLALEGLALPAEPPRLPGL